MYFIRVREKPNFIRVVCKQTRVLNGKSNIYYDKDKIKLSCYMLLEVSYVRNHQAYIMFILPKKIKQNSH